MRIRLTVNQIFSAAILLALFIFYTVFRVYYKQSKEERDSVVLMTSTQELLYHTAKISAIATAIETGSRAFLLTGQQQFKETYTTAKKEVAEEAAILKTLTSDDALQQKQLDSLLTYVNQRIFYGDSLLNKKQDINMEAALQIVANGTGKLYLDNVRYLVSRMQEGEQAQLQQRKAANEKETAKENVIFLTIAFLMLVLLVALFWKERQSIEQRERKNAQQEMEFLNLQINQANDSIYIVDADRKIKSWNKGAENLYGFLREEVLHRDPNEILKTDLTVEEIDSAIKLISEQDYWTGELRRIRKDGTVIYVHSSTTTIRNSNGVITGYVAVSFDITSKKKLQEQVNHLADMVEQSSEAFISTGVDKKILTWNSGAEKLHGYTKEEAIGKTAAELKLIPLTENEMENDMRELLQLGSWKKEMIFYHKNGASFFGAISASLIRNDSGEVTSVFFIVKDISLRKELEEQLKKANEELEEKVIERTREVVKREKRFRTLIENNYDIINLMDASFKVFYRSPSATRITGWTDEDMLHSDGENKMNIHPDDKAKADLVMKECLANPGKPVYAIYRNRHKNGHYIWLEGAITNLLQDPNVNAILFNFRDVTERIEAEEKIASSEIRFRSLIENSVEGISLLDENSNVIYRSPSAYKIIGNNPMQNTISYAHPESVAYFKAKFAETLNNPGVPVTYRVKYLHPDGYHFWSEGTFTNLLHLKGVNAVVANYHDVTAKVEAEEKLESSEKRFRAMVENNKDVIMLLDESFNVTYRSPSATAVNGWADDDVKTMSGIQNIHPDDMDYAKGIIEKIFADPGKPYNAKFRNRHKNGTFRWLEGTVTNLLQDKNVNAILFNFRDVTERIEAEEKIKASEEQFRYSMDNMLEGVQIIGFDWRYIYVNKAMAKQGKYTKEELLGHSVMEKYPGIEQTKIFNIYQRCFNERIAIHLENEFVFPDGAIKWFELSFLPVPEGIFILSIDITERKHAEESIKKMNTELEKRVSIRTAELKKANEELEAFSYSVSHDLRAPLRAIIGFSNILEEDYSSKLDDEAKRITDVIKSNTTKMGNLIDDLLTFSRMGRHEIQRSEINSTGMVQEIINGINNNGAASIKWVVHQLPKVRADASMIRQVWFNLISNAVKYSAKSSTPEIQIGSFKHEGMVVFFVEDNGVGFDEKYKNKLYKVFQRLHSTEDFEGTGIGLAIVEKIVSKHGGHVWAEAEINKGASFYFSLPDN